MISAVSPFFLFFVCTTVTIVSAAPARVVTYNQTQYGNRNILADIENVLIIIIPPRGAAGDALGAALSILSLGKSNSIPLLKDVSKRQKIASKMNFVDIDADSKSIDESEKSKPVEIKEQSLPEPPEPAKPEEKFEELAEPDKNPEPTAFVVSEEAITAVPVMEPAFIAPEAEVHAVEELPPAKLQQIVTQLEPAIEVASSRTEGRRSVISTKLLGFGLAPATD